jgi:predicted N-acyltransferase
LDESLPPLLAQLKTLRTTSFEWNVRFDHRDLARQLYEAGIGGIESTTQVLYLDRPYAELFQGFSETARNKVRRAEREGVVVYCATEDADLAKYYALYQKVAIERKWSSLFQKYFLDELFKLHDDVVLLIVKRDTCVIGGGIFIRDGNSLFYWKGAMDYAYKSYFPHYAMINYAIRRATEEGMTSLNLGASLSISTLEQFKSFWGAVKLPHWQFVWRNPLWSFVSRCHARLRVRH